MRASVLAAGLGAGLLLACNGGGGEAPEPTDENTPAATATVDSLGAARAAEADDDSSLPGEWIDLATIYGGAYNDDAGHVVVDVDYADNCAATETGTEVCNTDPPAGGPHWSRACADTPADSPAFCGPAQWGIYHQAWEPETLVHNMEHGGVVLWYNTADQAVIAEVEGLFVERLNDGNLLVMAPYPEMEADTIALTSWSRIDKFAASEYSRERVEAFIDAHERRFNPESF